MSELAKCQRLILWLRTLESTWTMIQGHRLLLENAGKNPNDYEQRRTVQATIGHNLMTLIGEWPIENTVWDSEDLPVEEKTSNDP